MNNQEYQIVSNPSELRAVADTLIERIMALSNLKAKAKHFKVSWNVDQYIWALESEQDSLKHVYKQITNILEKVAKDV